MLVSTADTPPAAQGSHTGTSGAMRIENTPEVTGSLSWSPRGAKLGTTEGGSTRGESFGVGVSLLTALPHRPL